MRKHGYAFKLRLSYQSHTFSPWNSAPQADAFAGHHVLRTQVLCCSGVSAVTPESCRFDPRRTASAAYKTRLPTRCDDVETVAKRAGADCSHGILSRRWISYLDLAGSMVCHESKKEQHLAAPRATFSGVVYEDRQEATPRGFEPLRAEPNGFRVHLLSRSDTVSCHTRANLRSNSLHEQPFQLRYTTITCHVVFDCWRNTSNNHSSKCLDLGVSPRYRAG